jgi:hypothetical protein
VDEDFHGPGIGAVHPEVGGVVGPVRTFELDDVSSRPKAATCRRTPNAFAGKPPTTSGGTGKFETMGFAVAAGCGVGLYWHGHERRLDYTVRDRLSAYE